MTGGGSRRESDDRRGRNAGASWRDAPDGRGRTGSGDRRRGRGTDPSVGSGGARERGRGEWPGRDTRRSRDDRARDDRARDERARGERGQGPVRRASGPQRPGERDSWVRRDEGARGGNAPERARNERGRRDEGARDRNAPERARDDQWRRGERTRDGRRGDDRVEGRRYQGRAESETGRPRPSRDDRPRGGWKGPASQRAAHDSRGAAHRGERDDRVDRRAERSERPGRAEKRRPAEGVVVARATEPALPEDVVAAELDAEVRRDLRGLQKNTAESVARHLVAAGRFVDEDPERALEHARFARQRASRIAVVREAAGIAAYHAGEWAEALGELRAARRMGGGPGHLAVMADIERALGRPERAIELSRGPEASTLGRAERIELAIVAAGARRDLGELDAAVVSLQIPELDPSRREPWSARLFYAYADNLLAAGRTADAVQWFVHAADADTVDETDAWHRVADLTGEPLPPDDDELIAFGIEDEPGGDAAGRAAVDLDDNEDAADRVAMSDTEAGAGVEGEVAGPPDSSARTDAHADAAAPEARPGEDAGSPERPGESL